MRARLTGTAAFATTSCALLLVFVASGMPIALYGLYRGQDGITDDQLAVATVAYLAATACSLLVLGRLSDHVGRRPVAIGAVLTSLAGTAVLLGVDGLPHLLTGRVLQGVACGLASSAIGSYVVDTAPDRPRWLPAAVTGTLPPFAVPLGALASGLLADRAPAPRTLGLTLVCAALARRGGRAARVPRDADRRPGGAPQPASAGPGAGRRRSRRAHGRRRHAGDLVGRRLLPGVRAGHGDRPAGCRRLPDGRRWSSPRSCCSPPSAAPSPAG